MTITVQHSLVPVTFSGAPASASSKTLTRVREAEGRKNEDLFRDGKEFHEWRETAGIGRRSGTEASNEREARGNKDPASPLYAGNGSSIPESGFDLP